VCDAGFTGVICNQVVCLGGGNCTGHGNNDCFFLSTEIVLETLAWLSHFLAVYRIVSRRWNL